MNLDPDFIWSNEVNFMITENNKNVGKKKAATTKRILVTDQRSQEDLAMQLVKDRTTDINIFPLA